MATINTFAKREIAAIASELSDELELRLNKRLRTHSAHVLHENRVGREFDQM